ncbi:MAG TPA: hypothetical protein VK427_10280 [Kofleriaceae bacterium]|nr:hypothetical protein [Kofleriaceae bacterium]
MNEQQRKDATPTPQPRGAAPYKRSWKNLLINKRYQLRFTLLMVGLSSVLMIGLGFWVMKVANETTEVSATSVRGTPCPRIPAIEAVEELSPVPMKLPEGGAGPQGASAGGEDSPRGNVQIDESSMTMMPAVPRVPADLGAKIVAHWTCELKLAARLDMLERGRMRILLVLIGTGLLLVLGLAAYGIKMTHKVAGPLFKVGLYLGKMRSGRFDKVYSLRKGDQLVDFYEHFKHGHAGIVQMQKDDIARVQVVIAAAEQSGLGDHPTVVELRALVARKEKSLE